MSVLVVGSVALDTVSTPFGQVEEALGGSACYFATSASFFTSVSLVAVTGEDFPQEHLDFLGSRGIDLDGLQTASGKTFRWAGKYEYDLNEAHTLDTQLNVFEAFDPELPDHYRDAEFVFLANIHPELQLKVLQQVRQPKLVALDTMNFWIEGSRDSLLKTLKHVDLLMINEAEARQLAEEANLVQAARKIQAMGPKSLVVKRGEYGVLMFHDGHVFSAPAYPLEEVFDPTGAGDTFGGGFMGYLASTGDASVENMRRAVVVGSAMASFTVEKFSLDRLRSLEFGTIQERFQMFKALTDFGDLV